MKKWFKWGIVFSFLLVWTLFVGVDKSQYLKEEIVIGVNAWVKNDAPVLDFALDGRVLSYKQFKEVLMTSDFQYKQDDLIYSIELLKFSNNTYKKCKVIGFLRAHPEIIARFPELEDEFNINWFSFDGISCLHTAGGRTGIFTGGGIS